MRGPLGPAGGEGAVCPLLALKGQFTPESTFGKMMGGSGFGPCDGDPKSSCRQYSRRRHRAPLKEERNGSCAPHGALLDQGWEVLVGGASAPPQTGIERIAQPVAQVVHR
ncbi:hypothetical protein NBRC116586_17000 [Pseudooceanicola nitratireducens]